MDAAIRSQHSPDEVREEDLVTISAFGGVQEVRPDVARVRLLFVNAYLVGPREGPWVLVDAGLPGTTDWILEAARARFGNRAPHAIVLTHGHVDHVGALRALTRTWDVPVLAHTLELPYITGRSAYPPPDPTVGGGMMAKSSPLFPPGPFDFGARVEPLPENGRVRGLPGWRWVHTPGHTPGHVALFRDADRTLIAGDAFVTTMQESAVSALTQRPRRVSRPPAYYTPDWDAARHSVELLSSLRPEVAATGHGDPMHGEVLRQELAILARDFEVLARPREGRYVHEHAVADTNGVQYVPPAPGGRKRRVPLGVAVGAAALGWWWWRSRRGA